MILTSGSKYPIGLDVSDLCLKLVQLQKKGTGKPKIQAIGRINIPAGLICNGEIKNQEKVAELIKQLIGKPQYGKANSDSVVVSLPETKTFIKLVEIPKTPNELADIIETEIQKHVPMLLADIYYDWQIIEDRNDTVMILIGAAPKYIVNQYNELLDKAKLSVEALEIEPVAISRAVLIEENPAFKKDDLKNNYAIIDIGAKRTSVTAYSKNTILFTASVPISGEKITSEIAENLEISLEQAEKAKIICGLNDKKTESIINSILSDTIDDLTFKIKDVVEFNESHFSKLGPINIIQLCGGGANIKGIKEIISKTTGIEAQMADPLINLGNTSDEFADFLSRGDRESDQETFRGQSNAATYATAIGLALRGIYINSL